VSVQFWVANSLPYFSWKVLSDAYSDRYKNFINSEVLNANTMCAEENQHYPGISRERVKSVMASMSSIPDGAVVQGPHLKEQLHKLSLQIIRHGNTLRSIMGTEYSDKTSAASEKVDPDWRGSDQVGFNSSTIPIHFNYECSPGKGRIAVSNRKYAVPFLLVDNILPANR
jgi:hypothetical protein